jgi:hypothetical protein
MKILKEQDRLDFLAAAYLAGIDDDEEEDGIWEKFLDVEKANQP